MTALKKSEITKQKILIASEKAFSEKGFYGARVDEIAEASGVNKRMIYQYFGNKEELYITVLGTVYSRLAESEKELLNKDGNHVEIIKSVINNYFEFLSNNESFVKMVMWENLNKAYYLKMSDAFASKGIATELLRKVLRDGIEKGIFKDNLDIDETVVSINMFCFSYFSNIYTMAHIMNMDFSDKTEIEKRAKHVTDIILGYIMK